MMSRTLYLINFVLIVLVIFLASKDYEEWTQTKVRGTEGIVSKAKAGAASTPAPGLAKNEALDPKRYKSISEKNLFSPDRKEFPVPLGPGESKKPLARPNVTLYGIVISDELSSAVISNLGRRTEKNERDTVSVKLGDKVGEYRVAKILGDRINLEAEGDSFDVLLYDPSHPKKPPVVAPPPAARPSPTPTTPPRPFTPPIPGVGQPSASPPAGIGQAPLLPPSGREVPRASTLRQRRDLRRPTVQPPARTPVAPSADEDEGDDEED